MPASLLAPTLVSSAAIDKTDLKTVERIDLQGRSLAVAPHACETNGGIQRIVKLETPNLALKRCRASRVKGTVLVFPGGGYNILAIGHEGLAVADLFNQAGYDAVVLEYTIACPDARARALSDALAATRLVRENGADLGLHTNRLGIIGFSAGAHLAARMAHELGAADAPDFAALIYPAYFEEQGGSEVAPIAGSKTAVFILIADNDEADWLNGAKAYAAACQAIKMPQEFHLLKGAGHGFGLKQGLKPPASTWPDLLKKFLGAKMGKLNLDSSRHTGDPLAFGAAYDGVMDCTSAINQCLQKHDHVIFRGHGTALVSKPLVLKEGTWLDLDPDFTIKLADKSNCALLKNKWAESAYFAVKNGNPSFMSELYPPVFNPNDWVMGEPERNIRITGGVFDGNGANQMRQDWRYGAMGYYGILLHFVNIDGFEMSNVKLRNATTYNAEFDIVKNFRLTNISMTYDTPRANNDGLHCGGDCYNGVIDGVTGKTYDDMVALNGGDSWRPKATNGNAILPQADKVWYPFAQGRIADIQVRAIMSTDGYRAVRLLSNTKVAESPVDETEGMDNILVDGICGNYLVNAVLISSHIGSIKKYDTITLKNIKNVSKTDSRMANIHAEPLTDIDNLTIEGYHHKTRSSQEPLALLGAVKNLTLRDVSLDRSISIVERRFRDYNQDHGN